MIAVELVAVHGDVVWRECRARQRIARVEVSPDLDVAAHAHRKVGVAAHEEEVWRVGLAGILELVDVELLDQLALRLGSGDAFGLVAHQYYTVVIHDRITGYLAHGVRAMRGLQSDLP